jgi:cystathionine gamma-synthase
MQSFLRVVNVHARPPAVIRENTIKRVIGSMSTEATKPSLLTPEEAGRRAEEVARATRSSSVSARSTYMSTSLAHAGVQNADNAPMAPPISFSTTFTRPVDGHYLATDSIYGREDNATRLLLEQEVGRLECHGRQVDDASPIRACAFSSGMMAVSSVVLAHASPLHIVRHKDLYHGVSTAFVDVFSRFGVTTSQVDMTDLGVVREELEMRAKAPGDIILWIESPSNPLIEVLDIGAIYQIANGMREQNPHLGLTTAVDSTLAPPVLSQPLLLGVDAVMHSATKFLAGHSDATIGVVTVSPWTDRGRWLAPRLRQVQTEAGGIASPMDSWLTLRGLRTLHVRVERQSETALKVAHFLEGHPFVRKVRYPGLASHPHHAVATRQMKRYGGLLSFELSNEVEAMAVAAALSTIHRATSLGGTETLIEHRTSIEPEGRKSSPPGLLRLSVGLEDADDLMADLDRALQIAQEVTSVPGSSERG